MSYPNQHKFDPNMIVLNQNLQKKKKKKLDPMLIKVLF